MSTDRQPQLPAELLTDARRVVTELARTMSHQNAAVLVHAGGLAQHAAGVGLVDPGMPWRVALEHLAELHPGLAPLAQLPTASGENDARVAELWQRHQLMDPGGNISWWSYPIGDLYQELSVQARKQRALCQAPWWITELLIEVSYDEALELSQAPRVIDPCCGTGHILVEAFHRAAGSHRVAPYVWTTPGLEAALDRIHGVDLDPYAVVVARWRLLVKAWAQLRHRATTKALVDLPLHVAHADALLATDEPLLAQGRYDVILANPPYVRPRDQVVSDAIRDLYPEVCHRQYGIALPFHAKMMDLLVPGGWCAQLTSNAFMKREFGRRYVEEWLPQLDAQWIIDTSGVYIPGHGTPTVILVHRNQAPRADTVRVVQGQRGEPRRPDVPGEGVVWRAISAAVRARLSVARFVEGAHT